MAQFPLAGERSFARKYLNHGYKNRADDDNGDEQQEDGAFPQVHFRLFNAVFLFVVTLRFSPVSLSDNICPDLPGDMLN